MDEIKIPPSSSFKTLKNVKLEISRAIFENQSSAN